MNINQNINKLLYALKQKGQLYKINSFKFYSEKNDKYSTKYQVMKRELVEVYNEDTDEIEMQERYKQAYECYSKIDLMKHIINGKLKEYHKHSGYKHNGIPMELTKNEYKLVEKIYKKWYNKK